MEPWALVLSAQLLAVYVAVYVVYVLKEQGCTLRLRYGYATVFQTVAVGRSPSLPKNFSVDTLCKMQA